MKEYLVGSGHFAIGFCLGFIMMYGLNKKYKTFLKVQMYSSFIPFIVGVWAALPYLFVDEKLSKAAILNLFVFYDYLHQHTVAIALFGRLHLVVLICGSMYLYILLRSIRLVKYCRRYGWTEGNRHA